MLMHMVNHLSFFISCLARSGWLKFIFTEDSLQAQSAVEVKSFGVIQKAELKSQIIIAHL